MRVDPSHPGELLAASASRRPEGAASFEAALARAGKPPKGERTKPVEGHAYADILAGPRKGRYVNTSGNARDGETFNLVERDGRELHVYGSGKDRHVVVLKAPEAGGDAPVGTGGAAPTT